MENKTTQTNTTGMDYEPVLGARFKFSYNFAYISKEGYRHLPILYLAYGSNGFTVCIIGATITIRL